MFYWIFAVFSGLLFFLSVSLIIRRTSLSYKFLGFHLLLMAFILISVFFNLGGLMVVFPHWFKITSPLGYLFGPTYYFFVLATVRSEFKLRSLYLLHFLPFIFHVAELTPFFLQSAEEKRAAYAVFSTLAKPDVLTSQWGYFSYREHIVFKFLSGIFYTIASLYVAFPLLKVKKTVEGGMTRKVLMWIKTDIYLKLFTFFLGLVIFLFFKMFPEPLLSFHYYTFYLSSLFTALTLLFFPELSFLGYAPFSNKEKLEALEAVEDVSVSNAGVSVAISGPVVGEDDFAARLMQVLEENYSDEGLDVSALALFMHLSNRTLYRRTKESMNKTPAQLLLDFRMEKAYDIIQRDPEKTIATVAMEVGLVSNGYFASAFSERFGILPREFQKQCKSRTGDRS